MNTELRIKGLDASMETIASYAKGAATAERRALAQEAQALRGYMVKGLREQAPGGHHIRPLSPMTIALRKLPRQGAKSGRGSKKALIYNGDLLGSISAQKQDKLWYTVGVHRTARGRLGQAMANIAAIHEHGTRRYTITVTPRMRRFSIFLMMQGLLRAPWPVGKRIVHQTPARPFLSPAHAEWVKEAADRFTARFAMALGDPNLIAQVRHVKLDFAGPWASDYRKAEREFIGGDAQRAGQRAYARAESAFAGGA